MFQKKINEIFSSMPNVFSIADDIFIAGFIEQSKDMMKHLTRYSGCGRQETFKHNNEQFLFR